MQFNLRRTFFMFFVLCESMKCAKILVYSPTLAYSHMSYLGRLADVLVEAGHDVTVAVITLDPQLQNVTGTKLAKVINYGKNAVRKSGFKIDTKTAWEGQGFTGTAKMFGSSGYLAGYFCEEILTDNEFTDRLKAEKFELGLCEIFLACGYALFRKIGINNYVTASSVNIQEVISEPVGISNNPSFVPSSYGQFMDVMNYRERVINFIYYLGMHLITYRLWYPDDAKIHELSPNYNNLMDQIGQTSFLFVNSDEFLDFPRLISHKVIFIGGIAVHPPKPLNEEFQKVMDNATDGAVLVSFGTIAKASEMSFHLKKIFVDAFRSLRNVKFLFKYENESDATVKEENIIKKEWLPQNDMLHHPNLWAFITHCGLNSLTESIYAGVPVICIPLFGDQLRNTKLAEKRGFGIGLDKKALSSRTLSEAIHEILDNKKYIRAARRLAQMIREKPFKPRERFLRNVEFALKFGPVRNFDFASNQLNIFQYYLLDIIVPAIGITSLTMYFLVKFISRIVGRFLSGAEKSKAE